MQVEEKKRMQNFEKNLDNEQARIWKIDCENFTDQEKDINQKVIFFNNKFFFLNYLGKSFELY